MCLTDGFPAGRAPAAEPRVGRRRGRRRVDDAGRGVGRQPRVTGGDGRGAGGAAHAPDAAHAPHAAHAAPAAPPRPPRLIRLTPPDSA